MINPLRPVLDFLHLIARLGVWLWERIAFHPIIENNFGISLIVGAFLMWYLKERGSNEEREPSDALEEWTIDLLAGVLVSVSQDLPKALSSFLEGIGKVIGSGIRRIRESENISLFGGSLIDISLINWKTILLGVLGILGVSVGTVFGWFPF